MKPCPEDSSGEALLIAATATSIAIAKGKTEDELAILAAFFTVLGDSLALLAAASPSA
jgi:hypothetical protein